MEEEAMRTDNASVSPHTFAEMGIKRRDRYAHTSQGLVHLTLSELSLVVTIEALEGKPVSKAELSDAIGRNPKTISRLLLRLRREGVLDAETRIRTDGGRDANAYRIAQGARPATTQEITSFEDGVRAK